MIVIENNKIYHNRHEDQITADEAAAMIAVITAALGSSDPENIEAATSALQTAQSYIASSLDHVERLEGELAESNSKVLGLQKANNEIMRRLNVQTMKIEQVAEDISDAAKFAKHFE